MAILYKEAKKTDHFLEGKHVHILIVFLAIFSASIMGIVTFKDIPELLKHQLSFVHHGITCFFVCEMLLKIFVLGPRRFFTNGWHVFDFTVVAISLSAMGTSVEALSALRVLRLFALLDFIPKMHALVHALHHAAPGILGTTAIASTFFYVSALLAHGFFGSKSPELFGDVGKSLLTLFRVATLDGWAQDVLEPVSKFHPYAWVFFILFVIIVGFLIINLFIGVVVNAVAQAYAPTPEPQKEPETKIKKDN